MAFFVFCVCDFRGAKFWFSMCLGCRRVEGLLFQCLRWKPSKEFWEFERDNFTISDSQHILVILLNSFKGRIGKKFSVLISGEKLDFRSNRSGNWHLY